jgi:flagellin FlaB
LTGTKKGAVGIGTLIIFIAMVLVAAIAAAVLINVSGILQQRAMATGKESIAQVSSNLVVVSIIGTTNAGYTNMDNITIHLTAASGAGKLDLSQLIIRFGNKDNQTMMSYSNTTAQAGVYFNITRVRDPSNVFSSLTPVIDSSALVQVHVVPSATTYLAPRAPYHLELIPEHGAPTVIDGKTPDSYDAPIIELYP